MKLTVAAVGRLRGGPEAELLGEYARRIEAHGRALGLFPFRVVEIDDRKARDRTRQSAMLVEAIPNGAAVIVLDERGKALRSPDFAALIAGFRDAGRAETVFLIGGADGHDAAVRHRADHLISFGPMVWPHMLVRVMLAEQIYRAVSILAGTPYHRGDR